MTLEQQNISHSLSKRIIYAILVNLFVPLGGMSTDIFLPSMPAMKDYFATGSDPIQLTITLFALGLGIGQLVAGPICDSLGRKRIIISALLLQIISVTGILLAPLISVVWVCRLFQGVGAAFMLVPARAILNDVFTDEALRKQYNYLTISFAAGPIVAPFIGGFLQHTRGWQANFTAILVALLVATLAFSTLYQETIPKRRSLSVYNIVDCYKQVLGNLTFVTAILLVCLFMGFVATFNTIGSFIIQEGLGYSAIAYGNVALLMGLAWFIGNTTARFIFQYPNHIKIPIAIGLLIVIAGVMLGYNALYAMSLISVVLPIGLLLVTAGFIFPVYIGKAMSLFPHLGATANGAAFAALWCSFSIFSIIASQLAIHTVTPLAVVYLIVSTVGLLVFYSYRGVRI